MTTPSAISRRQWLATAAAATALGSGVGAFAQQNAPRVLRVGHQKGWFNILKGRGTLEQKLAPLGVKVTWVEFNAGPVQLEALNVGSIDLGDVGDAPPIFAQAAGTPLVYAGASLPRPHVEALIVPQASTIKSVADLKGKRIALNKGSNVHYFLVKLLEKHGLKYADVQTIFLPPPDARAAFEKGAVDAWVIWDPFFAAAQKQLGAKIVADATGVANNRLFYFTSRDYATHNADVLKIALQEVSEVEKWVGKNQDAASVELSKLLGLDKSITDVFIGRTAYGVQPVGSDILSEQQKIADTFLDLKLIPKAVNVRLAAPVNLG